MDRLAAYERQKQESEAQLGAAQGRDLYSAVRNIDSAKRLISELRNKDRLIDFLSSEPHWLPGYAFPQDVVKLLVRQDNRSESLRLERDLEYGIAEYAPGAEVIANGWTLVSGCIDLQNRDWKSGSIGSVRSVTVLNVKPRRRTSPRSVPHAERFRPDNGQGR